MIVSIGNNVLANAVDSDTSETVKLAFSATVLAKLLYEYAIWVKHLEKISYLEDDANGRAYTNR